MERNANELYSMTFSMTSAPTGINPAGSCHLNTWTNPDWQLGELYMIDYKNCSLAKKVIWPSSFTGVARE